MRKTFLKLLTVGVVAGLMAAIWPWVRKRLQETFMSTMSKKMPKMMANRLGRMDKAARDNMLSECRAMLDNMESKFQEEELFS